MKIAQIGGGNMGRIVAALARSKGHTMAIAIDSADGHGGVRDAGVRRSHALVV